MRVNPTNTDLWKMYANECSFVIVDSLDYENKEEINFSWVT